MRESKDRRRARTEITPPEFALIAKVARAFRTTERDELQAELARKLLDLKSKRPTGIRNWSAYVAKFLYNKANTWIDRQRRREERLRSLDVAASSDVDRPAVELAEGRDPEPSDALALTELWSALDPNLRRFWEVLLEEGGNQVRAADRLGIHRNTARKWRARILEALKAHGFDA